MSSFLLSKLDIDVLIQLAMVGPAEARNWEPLTDDPDRLGALLWSRNYEAAAVPELDGPLSPYAFAPLPITVTAAEGLKHCQCYRHQTAGDDSHWQRDGVGAFLRRLHHALIDTLPGMDEAPWGWDARALEERSGRPRPLVPSDEAEPAEDPRIADWAERWSSVDLPLERGDVRQPTYPTDDPRDLLASGSYRPRGHGGFAPVIVSLFATTTAAEQHFADWVQARQGARHLDIHVYRWDSSVAVTQFSPEHEAHFVPQVDERVSRLGEPDQQWWSLAPALREVGVEVMAGRVRLAPGTAGTHADSRAVFARSPEELAAVVDLIDDPEVRERVASIDTGKQTVLLLRGICEVAAVTSAVIHQELLDLGRATPSLEHALYLRTEGATSAIATVLVTERLTRTPARATVQDPRLSATLRVDVSSRRD